MIEDERRHGGNQDQRCRPVGLDGLHQRHRIELGQDDHVHVHEGVDIHTAHGTDMEHRAGRTRARSSGR